MRSKWKKIRGFYRDLVAFAKKHGEEGAYDAASPAGVDRLRPGRAQDLAQGLARADLADSRWTSEGFVGGREAPGRLLVD